MPKLPCRSSSWVPKYRKHKASGNAVVTLGGRDVYLGRYGATASRRKYDREVGEWIAAGRLPATAGQSEEAQPVDGLTIAELAEAYLRHADAYYRKDGVATSELGLIKLALRPLLKLYEDTPAAEFGPLSLKAVRHRMVDHDMARTTANKFTDRIRRVFRWAVENELVPAGLSHGLQAVTSLRAGRSNARECPPVAPVEDAIVDATIAQLSPTVAAMVRLQRLSGMRPAEVCRLRPCDVDRSEPVWKYTPPGHKLAHLGKERVIFFGPKAQAVLVPYLLRSAEAFCFSPIEVEAGRQAERRENRKTPMTPSQASRRPTRRPRRAPGERYTTSSYRRVIHRACETLDAELRKQLPDTPTETVLFEKWSPNQLRHATATELRKQFGIEAAQVVLGHSETSTTEIYAQRDQQSARRIMLEVG